MEQMTSICDMVGQYMQNKEEDKRITKDQAAKDRYWKIPICYDDDDDEESSIPLKDIIIFVLPPCVAITHVLLIEEPVDSLIMEDEHLDTISTMESDEVIKSSVEDLVPIPNQFEGFSDSNDDSTSIDDDSFSIDDIDYVEASPPDSELVSLEEVKDFHTEDGEIEDDILREKLSKINLLIAKIEALNTNPTPSSDFVLKSPIPVKDGDSFLEKFETTPKLKTFKFDIEEKNSGSTTIHTDISLPDHECFYFKSEPDPGDLTYIIDPGIRKNVSSTTNVNLPFEDDQSPLFAYDVWIFLPFLAIAGIFEASRARGFVLHLLELQILSFILGIQYPNLIN
ncbi:hypothetical protein Tco_1515912 [Tanacetum coccineum]